jgi:DNA-binding GntR family transcriptional regulator
MPDPELQDMSQGDVAYHRLLEKIRSGQFRPGDRLRETDVAENLALSRTPVREALRKLESDGIVEHRPRLGANPAEIDMLKDINAQIDAAGQYTPRAAALNQDFHSSIYLATRNRFLLASARALNNALILLGPTTLDDEARIKTVSSQHAQIIAAIGDGDQKAAGDAAEAHLQTSLRHRLKVLQQ